MKQSVFNNDFLELFWWENEKILEASWHENTEMMTDADFQASIQKLWNTIATYEPVGLLADTRKFLYTISVEMQEWYGENITEGMGRKTKKVAMLVSEELIAQLSIEQAIEEDKQTGFNTLYFEEVSPAVDWILKEEP